MNTAVESFYVGIKRVGGTIYSRLTLETTYPSLPQPQPPMRCYN